MNNHITWTEFYKIVQQSKQSQAVQPNWDIVVNEVSEILAVPNNAELKCAVLALKRDYSKYCTKRRSSNSMQREEIKIALHRKDFLTLDEEMEICEDFSDSEDDPVIRLHFKSLKRRQQLRRTEDIWKAVEDNALKEDIAVSDLLLFLLSRCPETSLKTKAKSWFENGFQNTEEKMPINTVMAIYHDCDLGRRKYNNQKKMLSKNGIQIFPSWSFLQDSQRMITPAVNDLPSPFVGKYFSFKDAITLSASRIIETLPLSSLTTNMTISIKFGFDGSGSHAIYQQVNNVDTNNMILVMFCVLKLQSDSKDLIWEEPCPNNPVTHRPLAIQMGKESVERLQSLKTFNRDMQKLTAEGFFLAVSNMNLNMKLSIESNTVDLKASKMYLNLQGADCDLCSLPKEMFKNGELVKQGMKITRTVESLITLFNDLEADQNYKIYDDGSIQSIPKDYNRRQGLTGEPIAQTPVKHISVQLLHALLRCFDHYTKIIVHVNARIFDWGESKFSVNHQFLTSEKKKLQERIYRDLNIKWDFPDATGKCGNTSTGNTVRRLIFVKANREKLVEDCPDSHKKDLIDYGQKLAVILRVFCSKHNIDVEKYKDYCTQAYLLLLDKFKWASITPSVHKRLGHSWESIQLNEGHGLGSLDEIGLEGNNKILRKVRTNLARKTSQSDNLTDVLRRMWIGSDYQINIERLKAKSYCKHCNESGHSVRYCLRKKVTEVSTDDDKIVDALLTTNE